MSNKHNLKQKITFNEIKKTRIILFLVFFLIFIGGLVFAWKITITEVDSRELPENQPLLDGKNYNIIQKDHSTEEICNIKDPQFLSLDVKAAISILITPEGDSQILFEKNTDKELLIASLTKLMTAYVVLQYYDLSHIIKISEQAILETGDAGNLYVGQKISVKELLFPLLIESSNDAAYALAEMIGREQFVFLMNKEAEKLGLKNTYFVNPTGLDAYGVDNYSTINDLVKFTKHLLNLDKNKGGELLWDILSTEKINLYGEILVNTNQLLSRVPGIIGGRTGWTPKAGGSLILVTETPKGYLINIVLGASSPQGRFQEMTKMINWIKLDQKGRLGYERGLDKMFLDWEKITNNAPWGKRDSHATIVFQNKLWLFGGLSSGKDFKGAYGDLPHKSDIWATEDGKDWQLITNNASWGERRSLQIVEFEDKLWLIGGWEKGVGSRNDIWSSINGMDWIREVRSAPWTNREGHTVSVFNNKIWVSGGVDFAQRKLMNDVWYSEDGINWNQATLNAQWTPRYDHTVTTFKDKMWLTGGLAFNGMLKDDIWATEDGKDWQLITNNASWGERHGHTSIIFQDKFWIIGGWGISGGLNDVWHSKDGSIWRPTLVENQWAGREDHTSVVFKDKIWIMGGMSDNWIWKSDIWHSTYNITNPQGLFNKYNFRHAEPRSTL